VILLDTYVLIGLPMSQPNCQERLRTLSASESTSGIAISAIFIVEFGVA